MSEQPNLTLTVPVISLVTRSLVAGHKNRFTNQIALELGVKIRPKVRDNTYIEVQGTDEAALHKARDVILRLDQKAGVISQQYNLQNTKGIDETHWGYIEVELKNALKQKPSVPVPDLSAPYNNAVAPKEPATAKLAEAKQATDKKKPAKRQSIEFLGPFVPLNLRQATVYTACLETTLGDDGAKRLTNSYVYAAGPFGGGKTFTPIRAGFELYTQGLVDEIIMIRPSTTSTRRDPGAMPGNPRQKIDPYIKGGVGSNIAKIVKTPIDQLEKQRVIRFLTPEFERGESYDHALVIVDETQNLTVEQAELLIGRLGQGSIMVFTGDIGGNQNDMNNQMPGLAHLIATQGQGTFKDPVLARHTAFVEFLPEDSAARNGILPHVAQALRNPPEDYSAFMAVINQERRDSRLSQAIDNARQYGERTLTQCANDTFKRYESVLRADFPQFFPKEDAKVVRLGKREAPAAKPA